MGAWLTEAELAMRYSSDRLVRLADRDGDGAADSGVLAAAIDEAESRATSRLLIRYAAGDLPTTPETTSEALKRVVALLAYWFLHERFELKGQDVYDARDGALAELELLARGQASLLLAGSPDVDLPRAQILTTKTAADATFTLAKLDY